MQDLHNIMGSILGAIDKLRFGAYAAAIFLVVAALLLVANTIRLAAFARRREIAIMRLVGASTLYIALPFLLEALVTAVVGVALAGGALAAVMKFGVIDSSPSCAGMRGSAGTSTGSRSGSSPSSAWS